MCDNNTDDGEIDGDYILTFLKNVRKVSFVLSSIKEKTPVLFFSVHCTVGAQCVLLRTTVLLKMASQEWAPLVELSVGHPCSAYREDCQAVRGVKAGSAATDCSGIGMSRW
jgi:hypothetical protein